MEARGDDFRLHELRVTRARVRVPARNFNRSFAVANCSPLPRGALGSRRPGASVKRPGPRLSAGLIERIAAHTPARGRPDPGARREPDQDTLGLIRVVSVRGPTQREAPWTYSWVIPG